MHRTPDFNTRRQRTADLCDPRRCPHQSDRNAGVVLVLVTVLLVVVLLFCGFAIDLAHMMQTRTELRAAADLSAKAASGELSRTQNQNLARLAAKEVAAKNRVGAKLLQLNDEDIDFGNSTRQSDGKWAFTSGATPLNAVRVKARRQDGSADGAVPLYFGRLYNRETFETQVWATATFLDVDICLVLDRSSSMKLSTDDTTGRMTTSNPRFCQPPRADSRWVALQNAVQLFTNHLGSNLAQEKVSVVTFASNYSSRCGDINQAATIDRELTADLSAVTTAMATRSATVWNGATDIAAGIRAGRSALTGSFARQYATKVMVVLTDGVYTAANPVSEASAADGDNIFVHTITFGTGANQSDMQAVAEAGNGNHYHAPDAAALGDVFTQIAGSIAILTE